MTSKLVLSLLFLAVGAGAWALRDRLPAMPDQVSFEATVEREELILPEYLAVSIETDRTNVYNRQWDGIGHIAGMVGPLFPGLTIESPPDAILCVVAEDGTSCLQDGSAENPESWCHDAFRCSWQIETPRKGPFALVIYDTDVIAGRQLGDLIEWVIVAPYQDDEAVNAVEATARVLVDQVAPTTLTLPDFVGTEHTVTYLEGEEKRRRRPIARIGLDSCLDACRLDQANITVAW